VEIKTIAVGLISGYDDVNSILLAGRADLCALGRAHLYDAAWTLHAAAEQNHQVDWPLQFDRGSRRPPSGRTEEPRPRLELLRHPERKTAHARWQPKSAAQGVAD
jgi:anthraniloyl-CoA monooxygenase